jgi:cell volume regulation protein A
MGSLDAVSLAILLGSLLVLIGILSSLIALRFGAPLLLVFLLVGMLAGEGGPGGIKFDDVGIAYTVGSIALALILFDGGLRTRFASLRNVLGPAVTLATVGVLVTTLLTAPVAKLALGIGWVQALLIGAVVGSTDAAAVFFLINARGLRLRPRVRAVLEVESGTNDPFAIFLALLLVEILLIGEKSWSYALMTLLRDAVFGCVIGFAGGQIITLVLNRLALAQGLHAPFVAVSALVVFAFANAVHTSGFLAVYLAGLVVGNNQTRAHNSVVVFLDAITWLAQIVMFVLLGLLAWPHRLLETLAWRDRHRIGVDADRASRRGFPVPRAVQIPFQRKSFHILGRPARRGWDLPRLDSDAGRSAGRSSLFRCCLCRGAFVAAGARLERGIGRAQT